MPKIAPANRSQTFAEPPANTGFRKLGLLTVAGLVLIGAALYLRQNTGHGNVMYNTAMAQEANGDFQGAEQSFLLGIKEDPKYAPCYQQLGGLYIKQKRFSEARDIYKRATTIVPDDGSAWFVLGTVYAKLGDMVDADAAAKRATELMPDDADAESQYGFDLDRSEQFDGAYEAYRKAHELQPSNVGFLITMCRFGLKEPFSVEELTYQEQELAHYLQANPTDLDAAEVMVLTEERLPPTPERLASGIKWADLVIASRPNDAPIQLALAQMYLSSNRVADASKIYETVNKEQPVSTDVLHGLLVCYTRLGEPAKAASVTAELRKAASHQSTNSKIPAGTAHS